MDYVRHGEIQGRSLVFFRAHRPCILPCLTYVVHGVVLLARISSQLFEEKGMIGREPLSDFAGK